MFFINSGDSSCFQRNFRFVPCTDEDQKSETIVCMVEKKKINILESNRNKLLKGHLIWVNFAYIYLSCTNIFHCSFSYANHSAEFEKYFEWIFLRAKKAREVFFFWMCIIQISDDSNQNRTNVRFLWAKCISEAMRVIILKQNMNMRTFLFCDTSNFQINRPNSASIKSFQTGKISNNFSINWLMWASYLRNYQS